jgi:acyl-CoA thioester hydrolase
MPDPAPLATAIEVRASYAEVDKMGVVYYGNYLRWFELGRAEYLRARGKPYKEIEEGGLFLPVVEVYARYREPAHYDDLVEVRTSPQEVGPVRVTFAYQVVRKSDGAVLVEGRTMHCCVGPKGRPRRMPPDLLALLRS